MHYQVYDKHTIILNAYDDNAQLLDKRSAIYSDRPYAPMLDLMGWTAFNTGVMRYGPRWKFHRRIFQQFFKPEASLKYRPTQTRKVQDFLYRLLNTPEDFVDHTGILAAATIMSILYAHDVTEKGDYLVDLAEKQRDLLSVSIYPGASLLHAFPILRFLPTWFPGAKFKHFALESKKAALDMCDIPIGIVHQQMKDGIAPKCVTADFLETCQSKDGLDSIAGVAATAYGAGAETTVASMLTFFQAMSMFPDVQRRAQKEIDIVIGSERLVTYEDRSPMSLPYVEALYREVMRWRPVAPLSVAHANSSDDIYKGYYIPKGTTIISNLWAIAHDPNKYPDPDTFNPDRFFDEDGVLNNDDVSYIFGFGRRLCPGRHVASATTWLAIVTILQNFNIQKKRDADGKEIPVDRGYTDGLTIRPLPFECTFTPRSAESRQTILEAVGKA